MANLAMTIGGAAGRYQEGRANQFALNAEADQFEVRGRQALAVGSLQAQRLKKANQRVISRQRAVLAASGFSATDVGASFLTEQTVADATIETALAAAQAEDEYRLDMWRAGLRRAQGADAATVGRLDAASALVSGITSWRERFGAPAGAVEGAPDGPGSQLRGAPLPMWGSGAEDPLGPLY